MCFPLSSSNGIIMLTLQLGQFLGIRSVSSAGIVSKNRNVSEKISKQKQLLDMNEASEFLGISKNTLYECVIQKKVPFVKIGRLTKFKKEALDAWLEQRTHEEKRDIF